MFERFSSEVEEYPVDFDEIFGILSNSRRRFILYYLSVVHRTVTLSDLSEQVAAWECGKDVKEVTSGERKRVYVSLYQHHLPKLNDVSAVSYDKNRGEVEPGECFDAFEDYLPEEEDVPEQQESDHKWTQHLTLFTN